MERTGRIYTLTVIPARFGCVPKEKWPPEDDLFTTVVGGGTDTLLCGDCRFPIAVCVDFAALGGREFLCPRCMCENIVPGWH